MAKEITALAPPTMKVVCVSVCFTLNMPTDITALAPPTMKVVSVCLCLCLCLCVSH
jgi:hypothetical protein